jgi:glycosyltransferase involved in cell wall biosynthesis
MKVMKSQASSRLPLRVLFAGDTVTIHSVRLVAALARRGVEMQVLNGSGLIDRLGREYDTQATNLRYDEIRLRGNVRVPGIGRLERRLNRHRLRRSLNRPRFDVIHVNNLYCGEQLDRLTTLQSLPAPLVVTAWGSDVDDSAVRKHPSYPPLRKALLSRATLITAWSPPMVQRCRAIVPDRPARDFRLIRWNPDPKSFNLDVAKRGRKHWRERLGIGQDELVFLSPRNTRPNYRIDRIVRAFSQAVADHDAVSCRMVLVIVHAKPGRADQDAYVEQLRAAAKPLGDRVRFVEQVPHSQVPSLFGAADAAISIPQADGGPATHTEMSALGVPLIIADLVDYQRYAIADETALIVDADSDASVADAIRRFACDDALRKRIAAKALTANAGTFDQTVDAYLQGYHDAIDRTAASIAADVGC